MDKRIFIDSDVLIDVLSMRKPFYKHSAELLSFAERKIFKGYTSPLIIANVNYVLQKFGSQKIAIDSIRKIRKFIGIVEMNEQIVDDALLSNFKDFEDALQAFSAEKANLDMIITRNMNDYSNSKLSVMSPIEALAMLR